MGMSLPLSLFLHKEKLDVRSSGGRIAGRGILCPATHAPGIREGDAPGRSGKWYEVGLLSQSKASEVAGVSRQEFLASLARFQVSPFQVTPDELAQEWERE